MKVVYYMCYSDLPGKGGLVFPAELEPDNYSLGIWTIVKKREESLPENFEFDAVNDDQVISMILTRVDGSVYQVNTEKHGKFFFRIIRIKPMNYIGNSKLIDPDSIIFELIPTDIQKLERTCGEKFFFVGRVDNNLENRRK